jgi:hypothetical protein
MAEDMADSAETTDYMHDLRLLHSLNDADRSLFVGVPRSLVPGAGYREAESAYLLRPGGKLIPVFKRWCRERSPPELYNHGFENMDSLGE